MLTRWRAIRAAVVFLVSTIVILYVTARLFILSGFEQLENQSVQSEMIRVNEALNERLNSLSSKTGDWGTWTQAYDYVAGKNPDFVTTEMTDATMTQLRINLILIADVSGKVIYTRGFDLEKKKETPFLDADKIRLDKFLATLSPDSQLSGVVLLPGNPMLVAARPIVTNEGKGPPRGAMVFGRHLDSIELSQLSNTTHLLNLTVYRLDRELPSNADSQIKTARAALTAQNSRLVQPLSEQMIAGYGLLNDLYGNTALMFRAEQSREVYRQGWNSVNYFIISLSVIVAIFAAVALTLAERLIHSQHKERESEELYYTLAAAAPDAIYVVNRDGRIKFANETAARDLMDNWHTILGEQYGPETLGNSGENVRQVLDSNQPLQIERRVKIAKKDTWLDVKMVPLPSENGKSNSVLGIARDITERKHAEVQVQKQMRQLRALHAVDEAITSSANISFTLKRLLHHAVVELNADAADVLLLEPDGQLFQGATSIGFHLGVSPRATCTIKDKLAGGATQERRTVLLAKLMEETPDLEASRALYLEGIVQGAAAPLLVKERVRGVLEVFHRAPFEPDPDWLNFIAALARQAAIAVDYAETSQQLADSNRELGLAYDKTLEGWIRALDLREGETEAHSRQIAELTVRLARAAGIVEENLAQVRRGALLHDIGKIAIPDRILHNPGILSEAERQVMQKHPVHAYEMLSPIPFLQSALDIPYCHHERWDGAGYPRGLAGENIPLAARAFAIVDAWDALRSPRPYRAPWDAEKISTHLRAQSGKQFDPRLVDEFLKIIDA